MMLSSLRHRFNSFRRPKDDRRSPIAQDKADRPDRHAYKRPDFLDLTYDQYIEQGYSSPEARKILVMKTPNILPWNAGYAECCNANRKKNEDQTAVGGIKLDHQLTQEEMAQFFPGERVGHVASLRGVYFGIFDGHGGPGAALMVADQLIVHLQEKLAVVRKDIFIMALREQKKQEEERKAGLAFSSGEATCSDERARGDDWESGELNSRVRKSKFDPYDEITLDGLVIGALEAAFVAMDEHIGLERGSFNITGGCCVLVALFLAGRLYVANAGDCRAVAYIGDEVIPMSVDFTPERDVHRIYELGYNHPELLKDTFTANRFLKVVSQSDIGNKVLYKKPYCSGWTQKEVTQEDCRLLLVTGKGRLSRLCYTLGVSRSLGDFELKEGYTKFPIKPFISCIPEVKVLDLKDHMTTERDVLVMGCDGLWDIVTNNGAGRVVKAAFDNEAKEHYVYSHVAYKLVLNSRGLFCTGEPSSREASGDANAANHRASTNIDKPAPESGSESPLKEGAIAAGTPTTKGDKDKKSASATATKAASEAAPSTPIKAACSSGGITDGQVDLQKPLNSPSSNPPTSPKKSSPNGDSRPQGWRTLDEKFQSSMDDITALVIPLDKAYEYTRLQFGLSKRP